MNDVVVTLSGVINVKDMEGKNAAQLIDLALAVWNIPKESVENPFVIVHSKVSNRYEPIHGEQSVGKIDPETDVLRVVLPLKASEAPIMGEKQYLVD